jgi:threonine/homoserine/homoserine lactone efflux protein
VLILFFKGLLIGFSIAAPVGPIGVLCIRRTLSDGRLAGLLSGFGAASADAFYGLLAAGGISAVTSFLATQQTWIHLFGSIFLALLGIKTLLSKPVSQSSPLPRIRWAGNFLSTFMLTLTNPMTILSFIGIFAGLGLGASGHDLVSAPWIVVGVFTGSVLWWLILSTSVSLLRGHLSAPVLLWVNRISGLVLIIFAAWSFISLLNSGLPFSTKIEIQ